MTAPPIELHGSTVYYSASLCQRHVQTEISKFY
jgi:hypothetical protein